MKTETQSVVQHAAERIAALRKGDKVARHFTSRSGKNYGLVDWTVYKINRTTYSVCASPSPDSHFTCYINKRTGELSRR